MICFRLSTIAHSPYSVQIGAPRIQCCSPQREDMFMCLDTTIEKGSWHCQFKQWYSVPTRTHYHPGPILLLCSILFLKSGLQCQAWILSGGAGLKPNQRTDDHTHYSSATVTQVAPSCPAAGFTDSQLSRTIDCHLLPCPQQCVRHLLGRWERARRRGVPTSIPACFFGVVHPRQCSVFSNTVLPSSSGRQPRKW